MRQRLIFKINNSEYERNKYSLQIEKKTININDADIEKIVLSNKTYGKHGANKYYISYLSDGFKPLRINIKNMKLYTNHMNVLANDNEFLKYTKIWNEIETLFNEVTLNKKGFHCDSVHNKYIKTKISSYNKNFHDFQNLVKNKYCGHSILLLESICEVKNKYYPQTFLDKFFECNSAENRLFVNRLFKELVQIVDWSDNES